MITTCMYMIAHSIGICRIVLLTLFAIAYLQIRLQSNIVGFSLVNIINND